MTFSELVRTFMITLQYSLVIEATPDSNFFGFYSPELEACENGPGPGSPLPRSARRIRPTHRGTLAGPR